MTILHEIKHKTIENFNSNLEEVNKLLNFDKSVLDNLIGKLNGLHEVAKRLSIPKGHEFWNKLINMIKEIEYIRSHDSINICNYNTINNQCVVLLVSHFTATLHDLFRNVIEVYIENSITEHLDDVAKIEFTVKELIDHTKDDNCISDIILEKDKTKSVNFQDMKSTKRAFDSYFQIHILNKTSVGEKNIIFAQIARHNIVHYGAIVNQQFITRIKILSDRDIKSDELFEEGQELKFSQKEIEVIAASVVRPTLLYIWIS